MRRIPILAAVILTAILTPAPAHASTPVRVMALGDSITDGYTPAGCPQFNAGYVPPQGSYRVQLSVLLPAGSWQWVGSRQNGPLSLAGGRAHEGHCGIWVADEPHTYDYSILHYIDGWLAAARPDVIIVDAGTNDLHNGTAPSVVASRMTRLLNRIYADEPHVRVLLTTLTHTWCPTIPTYNGDLWWVASAQRTAGHNVQVVDIAALAALVKPANYQDGTHPNATGYAKIGRALAPAATAAIHAVQASR